MKPVPDFSTQHTFNQRRLRRATIYIEVSDVGQLQTLDAAG